MVFLVEAAVSVYTAPSEFASLPTLPKYFTVYTTLESTSLQPTSILPSTSSVTLSSITPVKACSISFEMSTCSISARTFTSSLVISLNPRAALAFIVSDKHVAVKIRMNFFII